MAKIQPTVQSIPIARALNLSADVSSICRPVVESHNFVKKKIPKAVREQLWLKDMGKVFQGKCKTSWCKNTVTLFDYQCGHNVPESKGGPTVLDNLVVVCSRCNTSMGNKHTFTEWTTTYGAAMAQERVGFFRRLVCCYKKLNA